MRMVRYLGVFASSLCLFNGPAHAESGGFFKDMFSGGGGRDSPSMMAPRAQDPNEAYCPPVAVTADSAVIQSFSGAAGDIHRMRHQIVFGQLSRECAVRPDGGVTVKVGAVIRALLGPAGSPGRFDAPLTFAIKRNEKVVASHTRRVSVPIPAGAAQGTVSVVEEGLIVPPDMAMDYEIEVALAGQPARAKPAARSAARRGAKPADDVASGGEAAGQ